MKNKGLEISNLKVSKLKISNRKLRGEWAEMRFMVRAAEHGFQLNKPWGEMSSYDFVVGHEDHFARVQVKSTVSRQGTSYTCTVRGGHRPYVANVFDFLAAYVVPEDTWYLIPAKKIEGKGNVQLSPHSTTHNSARYKEAWHLLRKKSRAVEGVIPHIEACAAGEPALLKEPSGCPILFRVLCEKGGDFR